MDFLLIFFPQRKSFIRRHPTSSHPLHLISDCHRRRKNSHIPLASLPLISFSATYNLYIWTRSPRTIQVRKNNKAGQGRGTLYLKSQLLLKPSTGYRCQEVQTWEEGCTEFRYLGCWTPGEQSTAVKSSGQEKSLNIHPTASICQWLD